MCAHTHTHTHTHTHIHTHTYTHTHTHSHTQTRTHLQASLRSTLIPNFFIVVTVQKTSAIIKGASSSSWAPETTVRRREHWNDRPMADRDHCAH